MCHTGIGGAPPPRKDMHRFVKWPKYVRIQRQRRVLNQRLKVPPALNRFTKALDRNTAQTLFNILLKYRPEDRAAKKVGRMAHLWASSPSERNCPSGVDAEIKSICRAEGPSSTCWIA